ncbi:electron transfer flavoprotein subunit alpha/FixB family protein [Acidobacteria bacterium AH-259-D05]|nr:electron transfer flavoprotein subunit alpha/FixB family protein [Acidobacteria bacterium AH-259-D05]
MAEAIYVLIDHGNGEIRTPSLESLVVGQRMAEEADFSLHALILGHQVRHVAEQVANKKVDSVLLVEDQKLENYDPDAYCEALKQVLTENQPYLVLMGHIYQNIDLAPKLAAAINTGLVTDCIGYRKEEKGFTFVRQMFRNKVNADVQIRSQHPWIVTMQSGSASVDNLVEGSGQIVEQSVDLSAQVARRKLLEVFEAIKGKVDLSKAESIVAVGRGIKKEENLKIIEDLAEVLGAEIAASRPVVDSEWLSRDRQVGSSGQTVSPRLYLACGISGAIQHIVGMKSSNCIVAINSDPNAPIFNIASYGIVGDLFEIVPALTKKLREVKGQ